MQPVEGEPWKTGGYGTTVWHHQLACGHVFSRKRRLPQDAEVDCDECAADEQELRSLGSMPDPGVTVEDDEYAVAVVVGPVAETDPVSETLEWAAFSRAAVAHALGVMVEQVEIVVGDRGIEGGMIFLGPGDVDFLVNKLTRGTQE